MEPSAFDPIAAPGTCAEHPGRKAAITCKECGDYACSECTVDTLWGATLCARCKERGRATYPLPWLKSLAFGAWIATSRAVLFEARIVFEHFPPGRPGRALGYALAWVLPLLLIDAIVHQVRGRDTDLLWTLGFEVAQHVVWLVAAGVGFFLSVRALGGRPAFWDAIAATGYISAFSSAAGLAGRLPFLGGWLGIPFMLLSLYFTAWSWSLVARTHFGLGPQRATLAGVLACAAAFLLILLVSAIYVGSTAS